MKPLTDLPLFRYPAQPGFKAGGTSRDAARAVAAGAPNVREKVFDAIAASEPRGLTADEAASAVGRKPAYIRPRISELRAAGRIMPSGELRKNESNLSAKVWKISHE
jgi:hypothetical protein